LFWKQSTAKQQLKHLEEHQMQWKYFNWGINATSPTTKMNLWVCTMVVVHLIHSFLEEHLQQMVLQLTLKIHRWYRNGRLGFNLGRTATHGSRSLDEPTPRGDTKLRKWFCEWYSSTIQQIMVFLLSTYYYLFKINRDDNEYMDYTTIEENIYISNGQKQNVSNIPFRRFKSKFPLVNHISFNNF
jgi:hypothetical protein